MPGEEPRRSRVGWSFLLLALVAMIVADIVLLRAGDDRSGPAEAAGAPLAEPAPPDPFIEQFNAFYDRIVLTPCVRDAHAVLPPTPERPARAAAMCQCVMAKMRAAIRAGALSIAEFQFYPLFGSSASRNRNTLIRIAYQCTARAIPV